MCNFKIVEGGADYIEEQGEELIGYYLESLQLSHRGAVWEDEAKGKVAPCKVQFYSALFRRKPANQKHSDRPQPTMWAYR